jgi:hypothetical protein
MRNYSSQYNVISQGDIVKKKIMFIFLIFFISCNPSLKKYDSESECSTIISGEVKSSHEWISAKDCLFFNKKSSKPLFGKIIEMREDGVLFNPDDAPLFKRPTQFYAFEELRGIINISGEILLGTIPKKYCNVTSIEFELVNQDSTIEQTSITLTLNSNEYFSYCIQPGTYKIENLTLNTRKKIIHPCTIIPEIKLTVKEGYNNLLGSFNFDLSHFDRDESIILGYKLNDGRLHLTDNISIGSTLTDLNLRYDFMKDDQIFDIDGIHILDISYSEVDKNIKLPVALDPLFIDRNPIENEIKDMLKSK